MTRSTRRHRGQRSQSNLFRVDENGRPFYRRVPTVTTVVRDGSIDDIIARKLSNSGRDWRASNWITGRGTLLILGGEGLARAA